MRIEPNEVSRGSILRGNETRRSSRDPNPIIQSESITDSQWAAQCPRYIHTTRDPPSKCQLRGDGVISNTNKITRSNSPTDKRPTKKASRVEAAAAAAVATAGGTRVYTRRLCARVHPVLLAQLSFVLLFRIGCTNSVRATFKPPGSMTDWLVGHSQCVSPVELYNRIELRGCITSIGRSTWRLYRKIF